MVLPSITADETLVARMIARDQQALASLYDRYRRLVFALALRVLGDRAEAEEVLVDVFHHAWRHAAAFDPLRGSVPGWLTNLCRSRAIDRLRARRRREVAMTALGREASSRADSLAGQEGPEEQTAVLLKRRRIGAALSALSPPQRHAIELAYYGGFTHAEIAARLGEPLGTVKTRIRQGLMTLRESLGAQLER